MPGRDSCEFNGTRVTLLLGDITKQQVDGIVNAANSGLRGGGGVDGAIHRAGGSTIMDECIQIRKLEGGCPTGQAVITGAGRLQAKHVIHAVGPVWHGGRHDEAKLLADAYLNSLRLADQYQLKSVAFPAISTGVYHYPLEQAADVAIGAVQQYCASGTGLSDIRFVLFNQSVFDAFSMALEAACPGLT